MDGASHSNKEGSRFPAKAHETAAQRSVSAIVVSYFTGPLLARSLEALRHQPEIAEIILVDNGNWPGAVDEVIGDEANSQEGDQTPVTVITGHGNVGFATACNLGARRATGDFLLFINPDAILPQGGLATLLADGAELARPWVLAPKLVNPDGTEQQGSRRATLTPWRAFVEATKLYRFAPRHPYFRRFNLHTDPCPDGVTPLPCISGAAFLVPAEDFSAIGGMDEKYFLHAEDVDFCLRFSNAGGAVYFDPNVSVTHFKSSSRVSPLNVEWRKTASLLRYFGVHFKDEYPRPFLWLVGASLWALFAVKAGIRTLSNVLGFLGLRARRGRRSLKRAREIASVRSGR
ncbi:MAG: glycosyltransferase family 2 protein [Pseudomonadota bacterium]